MTGWLFGEPKWRRGLTHIWCTVCHADLDWAQPEFCARHPEPVCGACAALPVGTIHATARVLSVLPSVKEVSR